MKLKIILLFLFALSIVIYSCSTIKTVLVNTLDVTKSDTSYSVKVNWYASNIYKEEPFSPQNNHNGTKWYETVYTMYDNEWKKLGSNYDEDWNCTNCDRYYRGSFYVSSVEDLYHDFILYFKSDDGIWIWINGNFLGHFGGEVHEEGCVNMTFCIKKYDVNPILIDKYITSGENQIAVRVSQSIGTQYFACEIYAKSNMDEGKQRK